MLAFLSAVSGHASLIMPPTRNSIDAELPAWSGGKHPMTGWIEPYSTRLPINHIHEHDKMHFKDSRT